MSLNGDCLIERLLVKNRLLNSVKLHMFTHGKVLYKKVRNHLGWTKVIANVVLAAYSEFIELKIVGRDWEGNNIIPSWCIREVWKTHALSDRVEYEEGCKRLCGRLIRYQIELKQDPDSIFDTKTQHEKLTKQMYWIRFNQGMNGVVWDFRFNPVWKEEYQKVQNVAEKFSFHHSSKEKKLSIKSQINEYQNKSTENNKETSSPLHSSIQEPSRNNSTSAIVNNNDITAGSSQSTAENSSTPPNTVSRKRRTSNRVVVESKEPVMTRSRAKRMRLTL